MVARRRSSVAAGGFWAWSGPDPSRAISNRRMGKEAVFLECAFSEFIRKRECTGALEKKKAAPFGATLFKEVKWRESEES
jgi:hypothetical protein